jgi:hypothetical protein
MVLGVLAFPLAKIAEAHRVSEDGRLRGKLVLVVGLSCMRVQTMQADRTRRAAGDGEIPAVEKPGAGAASGHRQ